MYLLSAAVWVSGYIYKENFKEGNNVTPVQSRELWRDTFSSTPKGVFLGHDCVKNADHSQGATVIMNWLTNIWLVLLCYKQSSRKRVVVKWDLLLMLKSNQYARKNWSVVPFPTLVLQCFSSLDCLLFGYLPEKPSHASKLMLLVTELSVSDIKRKYCSG